MRSRFALYVSVFCLVFAAPYFAWAASAVNGEQGFSLTNQILIAQSDDKKPTGGDDEEEEEELDEDDC